MPKKKAEDRQRHLSIGYEAGKDQPKALSAVFEYPPAGKRFIRVGWESGLVAVEDIEMVFKYRNSFQFTSLSLGRQVIDALDGRSVRSLVLMKDGKLIRCSRPAQEIQNELLGQGA